MTSQLDLAEGQILVGPLFPEPVRVETIRRLSPDIVEVGVVGLDTQRFRRVTLTPSDIATLRSHQPACSYQGDGTLLKLGLQATALGIAWEFDP